MHTDFILSYFSSQQPTFDFSKFIKNLKSFKRNIRANNNKVIIRKLKDAKKVRQKIIKLKQDINKPDFGRN